MSLAWGVIQLVNARQIAETGGNDWTFDQIVPLILLCAPIVTVIEYIFEEGNANLILFYHIATSLNCP